MLKYENKAKLNKKNSSYLIHEPELGTNCLNLDGSIGPNNIKVILDPGATKSFISKRLSEKLALVVHECKEPWKVQSATGVMVNITSYSDSLIKLTKMPDCEFKERLFILPGDLEEVLLGETFLTKNQVVIDHKNGAISMHSYTIFMNERIEEWEEDPDKKILEKAFVLSRHETSEIKEPCKKTIVAVKNDFSCIKGMEMNIRLSSVPLTRAAPIPIPIRMLEATKNEIRRFT